MITIEFAHCNNHYLHQDIATWLVNCADSRSEDELFEKIVKQVIEPDLQKKVKTFRIEGVEGDPQNPKHRFRFNVVINSQYLFKVQLIVCDWINDKRAAEVLITNIGTGKVYKLYPKHNTDNWLTPEP